MCGENRAMQLLGFYKCQSRIHKYYRFNNS